MLSILINREREREREEYLNIEREGLFTLKSLWKIRLGIPFIGTASSLSFLLSVHVKIRKKCINCLFLCRGRLLKILVLSPSTLTICTISVS